MIASDLVNDASHGGHGAGEPSQQVVQAARTYTRTHTSGLKRGNEVVAPHQHLNASCFCQVSKQPFAVSLQPRITVAVAVFLMEEICFCSPICTVGNKDTPASEKLAGV